MSTRSALPSPARRSQSVAVFPRVLAVLAVGAPLLLVAYAVALAPDAIERARMVVQGLESTIGALSALLLLRAMYVVGLRAPGEAQRGAMHAAPARTAA